MHKTPTWPSSRAQAAPRPRPGRPCPARLPRPACLPASRPRAPCRATPAHTRLPRAPSTPSTQAPCRPAACTPARLRAPARCRSPTARAPAPSSLPPTRPPRATYSAHPSARPAHTHAALRTPARPRRARAHLRAPHTPCAPQLRAQRLPSAQPHAQSTKWAVAHQKFSVLNFFFFIINEFFFPIISSNGKITKISKNHFFFHNTSNKFLKIYFLQFSSNKFIKNLFSFIFFFPILYTIPLKTFSTHSCANHQAHIISQLTHNMANTPFTKQPIDHTQNTHAVS